MTDDLPFDYDSPATVNVTTRRCRRHVYELLAIAPGDSCLRCGRLKDATVTRRGKNNRARGNAIEREIGHRLGLRRVGQYGGPDDLASEMFAVQVKSGGSFSERYWAWLKALPTNAGQTPLLVVTDAPGPGRKRRAVVVLTLESWIELHGPQGAEE
jgi:hypothetical protein